MSSIIYITGGIRIQIKSMHTHEIQNLIHACRSESNLDRQIELLYRINEMLSEPLYIKIPSLLTNDYVSRALESIEEKIQNAEDNRFIVAD